MALFFAALNSGNNLLYLLLSFSFALLSVSGIFSEFSIRPIRVTLEFPKIATAGIPFGFLSCFENTSRRRAGYLLSSDPAMLAPKGALRLKAPKWLGYLPPQGKSAQAHYLWQDLLAPRRGVICLEEVYLATRGPFGLFDRRKRVPCQSALTVLPAPYPVPIPALQSPQGLGALPSSRVGEGFDLRSLRQYAPGESARKIAWRASAKAGELLVRETDREQLREVAVVLEPSSGALPEAYLERQAGIARYLCEELVGRGYLVRLQAGEGVSPPASNQEELDAALLPLATWRGEESSSGGSESVLEIRVRPRGEVVWPAGL